MGSNITPLCIIQSWTLIPVYMGLILWHCYARPAAAHINGDAGYSCQDSNDIDLSRQGSIRSHRTVGSCWHEGGMHVPEGVRLQFYNVLQGFRNSGVFECGWSAVVETPKTSLAGASKQVGWACQPHTLWASNASWNKLIKPYRYATS